MPKAAQTETLTPMQTTLAGRLLTRGVRGIRALYTACHDIGAVVDGGIVARLRQSEAGVPSAGSILRQGVLLAASLIVPALGFAVMAGGLLFGGAALAAPFAGGVLAQNIIMGVAGLGLSGIAISCGSGFLRGAASARAELALTPAAAATPAPATATPCPDAGALAAAYQKSCGTPAKSHIRTTGRVVSLKTIRKNQP